MDSEARRNVAEDVADRRKAAVLAGHTGDEGSARRLLADPDPGVRERALGALARLGAADAEVVRSGAADPEPQVRRRTAELLATGVGPFDVVLRLLDDADPTVVEVAAWAAGEREEPVAVEALSTLASGHDDPLVREAAVASLGAIGDERALPVVLAALDDRATVRRRAVIALAAFEGPEVDRALEAASQDRDWQVRQVAEDLLSR